MRWRRRSAAPRRWTCPQRVRSAGTRPCGCSTRTPRPSCKPTCQWALDIVNVCPDVGSGFLWMGELYERRAPEDDVEKINWAVDGHANVDAALSAALNISRGRAAGQLQYAIDLRERLPQVAAVFAAGAIDFRMMAALV